ncbi:MAG: DUF4058 family protein [Gemmataceae bacterium]
MPIHDWKKAPVGLYHHFHQSWTAYLAEGLNTGVLPPGYFALVDQRAIGLVPDVLALTASPRSPANPSAGGGVAVAEHPPKARHISRDTDSDVYAKRANRVAVRNPFGEVVALIELVSPGNKDNRHSIKAFIEKAAEFIANGVNLLVVDLFPPTPRDPEGIHKAIWDQFREEAFDMPPDKPLIVASYCAGDTKTAYVESVSVGDVLPAMALFLDSRTYVPAPLEETYMRTWEKCPTEMKAIVTG